MCANQEQHNWYAEQELFCGRVLVAIVNLLPHVEVVKGSGIEVEGDSAHVVEHEVRSRHVGEVDQGPRCFLRHAGHDVEQDLAEEDEDDVDGPRAWICRSALVLCLPYFHVGGCSPFAFTHSAFKLGRADWSLSCSNDSGGSL